MLDSQGSLIQLQNTNNTAVVSSTQFITTNPSEPLSTHANVETIEMIQQEIHGSDNKALPHVMQNLENVQSNDNIESVIVRTQKAIPQEAETVLDHNIQYSVIEESIPFACHNDVGNNVIQEESIDQVDADIPVEQEPMEIDESNQADDNQTKVGNKLTVSKHFL